jgi:hypothetical protein
VTDEPLRTNFARREGSDAQVELAHNPAMTRFLALMVLGGTLAMTGCYVEAGYDYPPDDFVASAPAYVYEGHPVYYYDGRWYYRGVGGRWAYYHSEPVVLARYRTTNPYYVNRRYVRRPAARGRVERRVERREERREVRRRR